MFPTQTQRRAGSLGDSLGLDLDAFGVAARARSSPLALRLWLALRTLFDFGIWQVFGRLASPGFRVHKGPKTETKLRGLTGNEASSVIQGSCCTRLVFFQKMQGSACSNRSFSPLVGHGQG